MDVLFCLALEGCLAGTGEQGDGGQEVLKADGWFFIPTFSATLTNSCTSVREDLPVTVAPLHPHNLFNPLTKGHCGIFTFEGRKLAK